VLEQGKYLPRSRVCQGIWVQSPVNRTVHSSIPRFSPPFVADFKPLSERAVRARSAEGNHPGCVIALVAELPCFRTMSTESWRTMCHTVRSCDDRRRCPPRCSQIVAFCKIRRITLQRGPVDAFVQHTLEERLKATARDE
jgi:hypothetical protein